MFRVPFDRLDHQVVGAEVERWQDMLAGSARMDYIGGFYYGRDLLDHKEYERAATVLDVCLEVRPKTPGLLFDVARAYAAAGERRREPSGASEKAVEAGFQQSERLKARRNSARSGKGNVSIGSCRTGSHETREIGEIGEIGDGIFGLLASFIQQHRSTRPEERRAQVADQGQKRIYGG